MSDLVPAEEIERIVGHTRHATMHVGRAVSAEQLVYVLHSHECVDSGIYLSDCEYALALDAGIRDTEWGGYEDRPVALGIIEDRLVPLVDLDGGPKVIDAAHLERQRAFSLATFGPGPRTDGVLDHIAKELQEIRDDPSDIGEWVDVIILAFDGAWRAGWEPQQIIDAIKEKQARNEQRTWPDWRTADPGKAIEHVRNEGDR